MKTASLTHSVLFMSLLFTLTNCQEIVSVDRPYQRVLVDDFSAPLKTLLPGRSTFPSKLTIQVSGTVSKPVSLVVNYPGPSQVPAGRDTLAAGTYAGRIFRTDFYSKEQIELTVTGTPGTAGSLTIDWYTQ